VTRGFAENHPAWVERVYSQRIYAVVARLLSWPTGAIPFSVAEASVAVGIVLLGAAAGRTLRRRPPIRWPGGALALGFARLAAVAAWTVLAFDLSWGFNYDREPVAALLSYDVSPGPPAELAALAAALVKESAALRVGLPEDTSGALRLADGPRGGVRRAPRGYESPALRLPMPAVGGRPKLVAASPLMSYLGIGGIFIPFTAEANVNSTLPDWEIPFTSCHELAHQRGFAREDEANYVGYLACRAHPDRDFQYSGTFRAALYALEALAHQDHDAYGRLRTSLPPALSRDLSALAAWHVRYASRLSDVQERVNDAYLKTQGQPEGVQSYGKMVDLLLAERRTLRAHGARVTEPR
jgi:uncharacterized protein DUF3810